MTIKHSAEVYIQIRKSKATFPFIFYVLYFPNESNIVIHGEKSHLNPKHVTESVESNLCLLKLREGDR